jgi:hypothetical protein
MYTLIRDHRRKFMAVFAVFLMVAFLLPAGMQGMQDHSSIARAYMGNEPITIGDYQRARTSWETLLRDVSTTTAFSQSVPLLLTLGDPSSQSLMVLMQGMREQVPNVPLTPFEVMENPETFALLLKEAQAAGITISDARLDQAMSLDVRVNVPTTDLPAMARARQAVRDFLMVEASYARIASVGKASEPMRQRRLAQSLVRVNADVAIFSAAPAGVPTTAAASTTAPTNEQLQAQFDKYADVAPGQPSAANPFGFGYRLPDAVKLQTITLTRDQLAAGVKGTRTDRQWEVEARKYVLRNPAEFPSTQPAPATAPAGGQFDLKASVPATKPADRTYNDLTADEKRQALDRVMEPEIGALSGRIVAYLNDRLAKDYTAAAPSTQPTTAPTTAAAANAFTSYAYLESVAQDVQKQFGVLPTVTNHADWIDRDAAFMLPGIGSARPATDESFAALLFASQPFSGSAAALRLHQFSRPLTDYTGNVYLFRLTEAQRAARAPSLESAMAQVAQDVRLQTAADAAKAAATALIDRAKTTEFRTVAEADGRSVVKVGPVDLRNANVDVPGLTLAPADRDAFIAGLTDLLSSEVRDAQGRPLGAITLPAARQVLAVHVTGAPIESTPDRDYHNQLAVGVVEETELTGVVQMDWFSFDGVAKRIDFKGDRPDRAPMTTRT